MPPDAAQEKTPEEIAAEKRRERAREAGRKGGIAGRGKGCGKGPRPNTNARDERGVRKQTYTHNGKEGKDYDKINPELTAALCDMMKKGIFGEVDTATGERVRKPYQRRKYEDVRELQDEIEKYIDYINDHRESGLMPDVEGLALWLGINRATVYDWIKTRPGEASDTLKATLNAIAAYKKQLALGGKIPPIVFATDFNNNHGYTQTQKVEIDTPRKLDVLPDKADIVRRLPSDIGSDEDSDPIL